LCIFILEVLNSFYIPRREFLKYIGIVTGALATGLSLGEISSFREYDPSNPIIDIVYQKVPGMTHRAFVVHLTDLHFGEDEAYVNAQVLDTVVGKINQTTHQLGATPDTTALIITGDLVSKREQPRFHITAPNNGETNFKAIPVMLEILQDLKATHRIGVLGNHDHKHGQRIELMKYILHSGIQLLDINSEFYTGDFPIPILGLPDFTQFSDYYSPTQVDEIARALSLYDGPQIVATHNASIVDIARLGEQVKNVHFLCGHTHGGHTKHSFILPYALSDEYESEFIRGIYRVGGNYVQMTNGIGQHPQAAFRQIPAQIVINVYGN
jgi:predicted MPP superfamily phosphohydrolase